MKRFVVIVLVLSLGVPVTLLANPAVFGGIALLDTLLRSGARKRAIKAHAMAEAKRIEWHEKVLQKAQQPPTGWWVVYDDGTKEWIPNRPPDRGVFSLPTRQYRVDYEGSLVPCDQPEGE